MVVNSIAVCHTIWNVSVHICSKALKAFQKNVGSCHSVNIVITDNTDTDTRPDFFKDQGRCLIHIFHEMRIIKLVQGTV